MINRVARACISIVAAVLIAISVSTAAPPPDAVPNSASSEWFKSLKQPDTLLPCCSISDCRKVSYRKADDGQYEVVIEGRWYGVPESIILRRKGNPVGRAIACYTTTTGFATLPNTSAHDREDQINILCFVPELPTS